MGPSLSPDERRPALTGAASLANLLIELALYVGALTAIFWRPGIFLALGGFIALVLGHLIVGAVAYRKVMSRPWPQVKSLEDDDDW